MMVDVKQFLFFNDVGFRVEIEVISMKNDIKG